MRSRLTKHFPCNSTRFRSARCSPLPHRWAGSPGWPHLQRSNNLSRWRHSGADFRSRAQPASRSQLSREPCPGAYPGPGSGSRGPGSHSGRRTRCRRAATPGWPRRLWLPLLSGSPRGLGLVHEHQRQRRRQKESPPTRCRRRGGCRHAVEQARARRRRRAKLRGYGHEFMDMNVEVEPDWGIPPVGSTLASDQGAGSLGFAGTARRQAAAEAAGLATLEGDGFGGGPSVPMLPGTWEPDQPDLDDGDNRG